MVDVEARTIGQDCVSEMRFDHWCHRSRLGGPSSVSTWAFVVEVPTDVVRQGGGIGVHEQGRRHDRIDVRPSGDNSVFRLDTKQFRKRHPLTLTPDMGCCER